MSKIYICERCGEILKPGRAVMLELDTRTHTYTDRPVPPRFSQGGFYFGKYCATIEKEAHLERRGIKTEKPVKHHPGIGGERRKETVILEDEANL